MQLKSESGSDLLQVGSRSVIIELIPMMPKEDEIPLIMKGNNPPFLELGVLREQTGNHSPNSGTCHGVEVVQD